MTICFFFLTRSIAGWLVGRQVGRNVDTYVGRSAVRTGSLRRRRHHPRSIIYPSVLRTFLLCLPSFKAQDSLVQDRKRTIANDEGPLSRCGFLAIVAQCYRFDLLLIRADFLLTPKVERSHPNATALQNSFPIQTLVSSLQYINLPSLQIH